MLKYFFLFLISTTAFTQVNDIELESLDDLSILQQFEEKTQEEVQNDSYTGQALLQEEKNEKKAEQDLNFEISLEEELSLIAQDKKETPKNTNQNFTEEDKEIIDQFSKYQDQNIQEIINQAQLNKPKRFSTAQIEALKIQLQDIAQSPVRVEEIPKGAKLIRLKDNKVVYTPKTISVKAHTLLDYNKYRYILNKDGKITYKVLYKNIVSVRQIKNLYRPPQRFKRLEKTQKLSIYDKNLLKSFDLKLHTGLINSHYTQDLLQTKESFTPLLRLEMGLIADTSFILNPGMSFALETFQGNLSNGGSYSLNSVSIGPTFTTKPLINQFSLIVQPRFSLISRVQIKDKGKQYTVNNSETALLLGLEKEYDSKDFKDYSFGFNWQRKWYKTDTKDIILETSSVSSYDDSFSLSLGYRFGL